MASVDERIVEMRFDREDFIKGTAETVGALGRLEQALGGGGAIATGVDKISTGMASFSTIATGALLKIGASAVDFGAKFLKNVMDPIFSGGKKRALNLEQANFQLTGLLGSADKVALVMDDVSYAVLDTAYGLDAAAVAAAQFSASGIQAGDEMKASLRGISGVAAMTGSSYEDIASIFTAVAGQGRVMASDLNRIAVRGINAAATLKDYFNDAAGFAKYTEADIRKLVSEGKVSFAEFSAAMDGAFGEHAKKANETFTGAMSNVRAALARIGADFYTIHNESMRRTFNAIRPVITTFQKGLKPLWKAYQDIVATPLVEHIEKWSASLSKVSFEPVGKALARVVSIGKSVVDVVWSWMGVFEDVISLIFVNVDKGSWLESVSGFVDSLKNGIDGLKATEGQRNAILDFVQKAKDVFNDFRGHIETVVDFVRPVLESLWELFKLGMEDVKVAFEKARPYVEDFFDYLFGQEGNITSFFNTLRSEIEDAGGAIPFLSNIGEDLYDQFVAPIVNAFTKAKEAIDDFRNGRLPEAIDKIRGFFEDMGTVISQGGTAAYDTFKEILSKLLSPFQEVKDKVQEGGDTIIDIGGKIEDYFGQLAKDAAGLVIKAFDTILDGIRLIIDGLKGSDLSQIGDFIQALALFLLTLRGFKLLGNIEGVLQSVSGLFTELGGAVKVFAENAKLATKANAFLKVAGGILMIAVALTMLSTIETSKLLTASGVLLVMGAAMTGMVAVLSKIKTETIAKTAFALTLIGTSMIIFSTAIMILGSMDYDTLVQGGMAVALMLGAITGVALILSNTNLSTAGFGLLLMAAALTLLIVPIKMLGEMDYETLVQGGMAVALMLGALTGVALLIGASGQSILLGSVGLMLMAGAITLLAYSIQMVAAIPFEPLLNSILGLVILLGGMVIAANALQSTILGAAALVVLAAGILVLAISLKLMSTIPGVAILGSLIAIAVGLGLILVAGAVAQAIAPGLLVFAVAVIAMGAAVLLAGAGLLLGAVAFRMFGQALPMVVTGLMQLATVAPSMLPSIPIFTLLAGSLVLLAAAGIVAGPASLLLGVGLTAMALGLLILSMYGEAGAQAVVRIIETLEPLASLSKAAKIAVLAGELTLLGAALVVLGAGLLLAGTGGILFGAGAILASIGGLALSVTALLGNAVIPMFIETVSRLGTDAAPQLVAYASAAATAAAATILLVSALTSLYGMAANVANAIQRIIGAMKLISAASMMASMGVNLAMSSMAGSMGKAVPAVTAQSKMIVAAFKAIANGISSTVPGIVKAVMSMSKGISTQLNALRMVILASTVLILSAFKKLETGINASGTTSSLNVMKMMNLIVRALMSGNPQILAAVLMIGRSFDRLSVSIAQNGTASRTAVNRLMAIIVAAIASGRGGVGVAAYAIGRAITQGMANGISSGQSAVTAAARRVAASSLASAKSTLAIQSPSRRFYEVGVYSVMGLANALNDNVDVAAEASANLGEAMVSGVQDAVDGVDSTLTDWSRTASTMTPVVTLGVSNGYSQGGFSYGVNSANMASTIAKNEKVLTGTTQTSGATVTNNFNQYNTSPETLSTTAIYRQTKNLFSAYAGKEK